MNNVLTVLVPLVTAGVAAGARAAIKTWLTPTRLAHVTDIAAMAVEAAEKLGVDLAPCITEAGHNVSSEKLDYAVSVVTAGAKRLGIKLTNDEVLAFVHAALADMERAKEAESVSPIH